MTPAARTVCLFTAGLVIWLTGCLEPGIDASVAPAAGDEAAAQQAVHYDDGDVDEGKRLFVENCAACHGTNAAENLDLQAVTDHLEWTDFTATLDKGPDVMPAWPQLDEDDRRDLWAFLGTDQQLPETQREAAGGCGCAGRVAAAEQDKGIEQARQAARDGCGAGCCDSGGCGAVEGQGSSCGAN